MSQKAVGKVNFLKGRQRHRVGRGVMNQRHESEGCRQSQLPKKTTKTNMYDKDMNMYEKDIFDLLSITWKPNLVSYESLFIQISLLGAETTPVNN